MAFDIRLYKFHKRSNSTARPYDHLNTGEVFSCNFLDSQSIMNPVIVIEDTKLVGIEMAEYTYAFIPSLTRFYFVSNTIVIDNNLYCFYLQVDVLATYRGDILASNQYVLRSTNFYNDYIIDTLYPTVPISQQDRYAIRNTVTNVVEAYDNKEATWEPMDFFHEPYSTGAVLFGVTGQGNVSVDYYVTSVSNFKNFIDNVVTATPTGQNWGNLPPGVQTTLSNFMQYITFAKWIPFMPLTSNIGSLVSSIYLGTQNINVIAYRVIAGNSSQTLRFTLSIPDHPLISQHGYYNLNPYREVSLFFLPLGTIPIDTSKIWGQSSIYVTMMVDLASANTEVIVSTESSDTTWLDHALYTAVTDIGINLSLTDYSMSLEAALTTGIASFLSNAIKSMKSNAPVGGGSTIHTSASGVIHGGKGRSFADAVSAAYSGGSSWHTSSSGTTHGGGAAGALHGGHGRSFANVVTVSGREISNPANISALKDVEYPNPVQKLAEMNMELIGNALGPIGDVLGTMADFFSSSLGQVTTNGHTGSFLMSVATLPAILCWFYKHGEEDYQRFGRPYCASRSIQGIQGFCLCKNAYISRWFLHPLKEEIEAVENCLNTGIYISDLN